MRMKEDAMNNGQTNPSTSFTNRTENNSSPTFPCSQPYRHINPYTFFSSFSGRYNRLPGKAVADSGYGSEENYRFMEEHDIESL